MRVGRAAWIGLNTVAFVAVIVFIILSIIALAIADWFRYTVGVFLHQPSLIYATRRRGLFQECVSDEESTLSNQCIGIIPSMMNVSFNSAASSIGAGRYATPIVYCIVLILVIIALIVSLVLQFLLWKNQSKFFQRTGQYVALGGSAAFWCFATANFINLIFYLHVLTAENYVSDPNVITLRSSWPSTVLSDVRGKTFYTIGNMWIIAFIAEIFLYASSFLLLGASWLYQPPAVERSI